MLTASEMAVTVTIWVLTAAGVLPNTSPFIVEKFKVTNVSQ
jgi:hypothetical protein